MSVRRLLNGIASGRLAEQRGGSHMSELEELTTRALALPAKSRAELAELLIQSLEESDDTDLKAAWLVEIHRRDQEIRAGASVTKPADQVLREACEHLRCLT
jgi:putative addiction module component (TIGR02574 family)